MQHPQRVLGIDPGTVVCGYGILDIRAGEPAFVAAGVLKAPRSASIGERLYAVHTQLLALVDQWRPTVMAVEEPFVPSGNGSGGETRGNARSALAVGQAQAVALLAAAHYALPVHRFAPRAVKSAVSGYGQGSKEQVAAMVAMLLGLAAPPEPLDATDALAVALCWHHHERARALVGTP